MQIKNYVQIENNLFGLTGEQIEKALYPHVVKRYAPDDVDWKKLIAHKRRYWFGRYVMNFFWRLFFASAKAVDQVRKDYTHVWELEMYPGNIEVDNSIHHLSWRGGGLEVKGWAEKRVHLLLIRQIVEHIKPRRVLEVGSGNGALLMMLASMCPEPEYMGVELTEAGVAKAKKLQQLPTCLNGIEEFLPEPMKDSLAFKRVEFKVANATNLPFEDKSFDLVITSLALEQMNSIQNKVLLELGRCATRKVLMLEPFKEFNREIERYYFTKSREYFSVPIEDLSKYGLLPSLVFNDFPSKILRGVGLVLADPTPSMANL